MKLRSLLVCLALASAGVSRAAYTPIAIQPSSYNADAIVESNATPVLIVVTTATVDNGTNNTANTWFEAGYDLNNPANGLPTAGSVFTAQDNANYSFQMPPTYTGPNGILIDTAVTNGTFTLTTPATYTLLSFLGSGGNGGDVIGVKVHHQDGSTESGSFGCPDWFGGNNVAFVAGGRCQSSVSFTTETDGGNPRIYFRDITLTNTTSPVTSIDLSYVSGSSGSHNDIIGVSGAKTSGGAVAPITVTGYTYDFVVEASAAQRSQIVTSVIDNGTNVWATTQSMDSDADTGNAFYEKGYDFNMIVNGPVTYANPAVNAIAQASGIPIHGTTFTNGDHSFTMAPDYTTNDVVWLSTIITNATITLATPTAATALSFLDAAGNGPIHPLVTIHHQDGTSETNTITINDWFAGTTPEYIPNGRVAVDTGVFDAQFITQDGPDRLFASDLPLKNTTSPVTSIDLAYDPTTDTGRGGIFALSGTTGAFPPIFTQQPTGVSALAGTDVALSVGVAAVPPVTYQWQRGTNGAFINLANGGNIAGSTTSNLNITAANYFVDAGDYRVIVTTTGGSSTSSVATVVLYSTNTDVTQPGDPITSFGANLFGDGAVANAIDNDLGTKFGANVSGPVGLVVKPSIGATIVTALRFFTANDTPARDPADYKLEGSIDNGGTYTLIASNSMTLPDGRNTGGTPDPLTAFGQEVHFTNTQGYTAYRLTFSHYKGGAGQGSFQIGEIELLGVTTSLPVQVTVPATAKAYVGTELDINGSVSGTPTPTARWQKQISSVYTDLTDGGTLTGSHTPSLVINPAAFSDDGQFRLIASNSVAVATSSVVQVTIFSTNLDVTQPSDPITDFGNTSTTTTTPLLAFDDSFTPFVTRGSGLNNNAGFPPFSGPVGLIITPASGSSLVKGIRFYTGTDPAVDDPADFELEGSNDGGTTFTTIVPDEALALPDDRNDPSALVDPLNSFVQEIRFANNQAYTTYRVTFNHTKDDNANFQLSIGEIELLGGYTPSAPQPTFGGTTFSGGNLHLTGSGGAANGSFSVLTNSSLSTPVTGWGTATVGTFDASGNFSISLPVNPASPVLFYLIKTQ